MRENKLKDKVGSGEKTPIFIGRNKKYPKEFIYTNINIYLTWF